MTGVNDKIAVRPYGLAPPAFALPDATRLGPVRLQVGDLGRSVDYYQRVLGMRVETAADDSAVLTARHDDRPLVLLSARPGVTPAQRGAFGLFHFAILLPDRAALGRFAAHLSSLNIRMGMADHLVSEALYLWDPDQLGIEVYADRPRAAWQYRGRELAMTTDPLDVADLVAAGAGKRWDGLPKGTTMGHVHLHVGDLNEAEAFYHRALGMEKTVWSYPGALFFSAGGYHHHLGTNIWSRGPAAAADQARLLSWELIVPSRDDIRSAAASLTDAGYRYEDTGGTLRVEDPWGTELRLASAE